MCGIFDDVYFQFKWNKIFPLEVKPTPLYTSSYTVFKAIYCQHYAIISHWALLPHLWGKPYIQHDAFHMVLSLKGPVPLMVTNEFMFLGLLTLRIQVPIKIRGIKTSK